jgi:F0F1-type ATP synthase membrane subunit c/vacuolar-type H+-ATPase subunit K
MDDVVTVLKDLQPAAIVVAVVALIAILSSRVEPRIGPWVSLATLGTVTAYVGNRVLGVEDPPTWLIPLAAAGLLAALAAGYRLWRAAQAVSNNDRTVGYVFPTAVAIVALWLSIALIEFDATRIAAAG